MPNNLQDNLYQALGFNPSAISAPRAPFQTTPFGPGNQGVPIFDPQTGVFLGLQQPGGNTINPSAPSHRSKTEVNAANVTKALIQNLPSILGLFNANIAPNELAQLQSSLQTSPAYAALAQQIASSNATSDANITGGLLTGQGAQNVRAADALSREIDPEFYNVRSNTAGAINSLLHPGLTGGETEAIQRSLNQQNARAGVTNPTSLNTVSNAMTFGNAARDRVSQAVQQATQFLPTSRSGVDTFAQATGKTGNTLGFQQGAGQQVFQTGNNAQQNDTSLASSILQNQNAVKLARIQQPSVLQQIPDY